MRASSRRLAELVTERLWAVGASGCEVRDGETFSEFDQSPFERVADEGIEVLAYFESSSPDLISAQLRDVAPGAALVSVGPIDADAWRDGWRQYFVPTRVSRRIIVRPSWDDTLPDDMDEHDVVLVIDPQMAFGTGTHETTRLCLAELDDHLSAHPDTSVLDVGSGSGILTMAAQKLGARRCEGIDIDPDAVAVARQNWYLNGLGSPDQAPFSTRALDDIDDTHDLVVANILSSTLHELRDDLVRVTAPSGCLMVSGLLEDETDRFASSFAEPPLEIEARCVDGEWALLRLGRR